MRIKEKNITIIDILTNDFFYRKFLLDLCNKRQKFIIGKKIE